MLNFGKGGRSDFEPNHRFDAWWIFPDLNQIKKAEDPNKEGWIPNK